MPEKSHFTFRSDLALVFEPLVLVDCMVLHAVPQPVAAVLARDHPLAARPELRLRDCLDQVHIAGARRFGVRALLDAAARRFDRAVTPVVETDAFELIRHYVLYERAVGFQTPIGLPPNDGGELVYRLVAQQDLPFGNLLLGQMRGRSLSVASTRLADQVVAALDAAVAPPGGRAVAHPRRAVVNEAAPQRGPTEVPTTGPGKTTASAATSLPSTDDVG